MMGDDTFYPPDPLTFAALRKANVDRLHRWHGDSAAWSGADWSNAMSGEAGEAVELADEAFAVMVNSARLAHLSLQVAKGTGTVANTIKKVRRHETGLGTSYNTPELGELKSKLAEELADVVTYCDLLADFYGIDLGQAVTDKFNKVSRGNGFPERL